MMQIDEIHHYGRQEPTYHIDGLVQERRNSSASALELPLSYTNPSIYSLYHGGWCPGDARASAAMVLF